jgi:Zn-dependent protease with chaperone function
MTLAAALLVYAVVTAAVAPTVLGRATWLTRSPVLGVMAWQAALAGVLSALVLLLVVAVLPTSALSFDLNHVVHACVVRLTELYRQGNLGLAQILAAAVGVSTVARLGWVLLAQLREIRRQRSEQRLLLDLLAEPEPDGALLLPAEVPVAYCVPGGGGRIVLTTAADRALSPEERVAVVAHERAHLRGRHDLVLLGANVAAAAAPWIPFFRHAQRSLARYVEMLADDAAARLSGRAPVAGALLGLGPTRTSGVLAASGTATAERVRRLLDEDPRVVGPARQLALGGIAIVAAGLPMLVVTAPVLASAVGLCPIA